MADKPAHRVVHGMRPTEPERVTEALLKELHRIELYGPEHLGSHLPRAAQ